MLVPSARALPAPLAAGTFAVHGANPSDLVPNGLKVNLLDYWRVVVKRRWIALGVVAASVTMVMAATLLMTPVYTATATIQIDRQTLQITKTDSVLPSQEDQDFILTQYELLKSRALAEKVVAALDLGNNPDFLGTARRPPFFFLSRLFARTAPAAGDAGRAVAVLMAGMTVDPLRTTRLVRVSFKSASPAVARKVANAIADGFVASNLDRRVSANSYAKAFLQDQLGQMQAKVEESERKLVDFAQKEQIVSIGQGTSLLDENLAVSSKALTEITAKRIEAEEIWKQAEAAKGLAPPQLASHPIIEKRLQDRALLQADYRDKLGTFKPSYPTMVQLKARIDEVDRQIRADAQMVKDGLRARYTVLVNQENGIAAQLAALKSETLDLQKRGIQYGILKREADTNRSIHDALLQRYKEIGVTGGIGSNNLSIVDQAEMPTAPSAPRVLLNFAASLGAGLVGGLAAALVAEALDNSIKSTEDLEHAAKATTLGVTPRLPRGQAVAAALGDTRSGLSEAYRSLCTNLQFSTDAGVPTSLFITSARPSEGKSLTARIIAQHFAGMGFKVLLVDCDLRNPSQHEALGMENAVGLSTYLSGACDVRGAMRAARAPNLSVVPSGPLPPDPTQLLGSKAFLALLGLAGDVFDLIVLDGPPVMGLADAPLIASVAAGTLVAAAAGETNAAAVRGACRRLRFARANLIGTVLTRFDSRSLGYGYGHDDYYAYGATTETPALTRFG